MSIFTHEIHWNLMSLSLSNRSVHTFFIKSLSFGLLIHLPSQLLFILFIFPRITSSSASLSTSSSSSSSPSSCVLIASNIFFTANILSFVGLAPLLGVVSHPEAFSMDSKSGSLGVISMETP